MTDPQRPEDDAGAATSTLAIEREHAVLLELATTGLHASDASAAARAAAHAVRSVLPDSSVVVIGPTETGVAWGIQAALGLAPAGLDGTVGAASSADAVADALGSAWEGALVMEVPGATGPIGFLAVAPGTSRRATLSLIAAQLGLVRARQLAESAHADGGRWHRQILDAISDMVLVKAEGSRFVWANAALREFYGMTNEQLRDAIDAPFVPPDETLKFVRDDSHVFRFNETLDIPCEPVTRHDGVVKLFHTAKSPIRGADGRVVNLVAVCRDITEKVAAAEAVKRSEIELRALFAAMEDIVFVFDREGRYVRIPATRQAPVTGAPSEILGRRVHELLERDEADLIVATIHQALASVEPVHLRYRLIVRQRELWYDAIASRLDADTVFWVARDITLSRKLEAQFVQAQRMESVGRLAGGVAHDFNSILTVILGHAALLTDALAGQPELLEGLDRITRAAERAASLTSQLLAYTGQQILRPRPFDLNDAVRASRDLLARLVGERVQIQLALQPGLEMVELDPSQLEPILSSLAANARDAMPEGGHFTISTASATIDGAAAVRLEVADDGVGMEPDVLAHAFEPFFTTKPLGQAQGLGLSMVCGVVEQSGGTVTASSAPGAGATFTITLRCPVRAPAPERMVSPAPAASGKETILLVEDEEDLRELARFALTRAGYVVHAAADPGQAIEIARGLGSRIHLVFSDVVMPQMNGHQMVERLREFCPDARVLYTSGYTDDLPGTQEELAGGGQFLPKPYTLPLLRAAIRHALDRT